jgi:hypothetical protein
MKPSSSSASLTTFQRSNSSNRNSANSKKNGSTDELDGPNISVTISIPVIQKTAKQCEKLLSYLLELSKQFNGDEFWSDVLRIIERVMLFSPFIAKITANDVGILNIFTIPKKSNELAFLLETLELIKTFIVNHKDRTTFLGITDAQFRTLYANDIAKLNHRIIRLTESFNHLEANNASVAGSSMNSPATMINNDSSFIQRRKEDLKVTKTHLFIF